MKILVSLILLILLAGFCHSQNRTVICGRICSDRDFIAHIYEPLNGHQNGVIMDTAARNSCLINGRDSIHKTLTIDRPTFITIKFETENKNCLDRMDVLLFPGDSVNLHFDLSLTNSNWVQYYGSNAAGCKSSAESGPIGC